MPVCYNVLHTWTITWRRKGETYWQKNRPTTRKVPLLESFPPSRNTEQVTSDLGGHFIDRPASQLPSILGTPTTVVPAAQPQRAARPVSGTRGFSVHPEEPTVWGLEGPASRAEVTQPAGQGWVAGRSTWRSQPGSWLGLVGARPARRRLKSAFASGRKMSLSVSFSSGPSTHWSRGFR